MGKQGFVDAFEKFKSEYPEDHAIMQATTAGFGGSGYTLELFQDGIFRVLWDGSIGNLYRSDGIMLSIPQLSDDEMGEGDGEDAWYDNAEMALQEKFDLAMESYASFDCVVCGGAIGIGYGDGAGECTLCGASYEWDAEAEVWEAA